MGAAAAWAEWPDGAASRTPGPPGPPGPRGGAGGNTTPGTALDRELVHRGTPGRVSSPCLTNPGTTSSSWRRSSEGGRRRALVHAASGRRADHLSPWFTPRRAGVRTICRPVHAASGRRADHCRRRRRLVFLGGPEPANPRHRDLPGRPSGQRVGGRRRMVRLAAARRETSRPSTPRCPSLRSCRSATLAVAGSGPMVRGVAAERAIRGVDVQPRAVAQRCAVARHARPSRLASLA